ncbi:hypothetical protein QZH41_014048 [Actinostola sp. cb2023]|nr:hypothetical protein QZH41_014048 [Actinostola sp. cb2023]
MPARKRTGQSSKSKAQPSEAGGKKNKREQDFVADKETGHVLVMGQGDVGQLGLGEDIMERKKPGRAKNLEGIDMVELQCGGMHTVALSNQGKDASGKVGLQPDGAKHRPSVILTSEKDPIKKIASGNDHTAALTANGDIFTWGCAEQGQLGRVKECFASRGGRRGLEYILIPKKVRLRKALKFKNVFCGSYATFAVAESTDDVYAWGLNNYGQLGTGDIENGYLPIKVESLSSLNSDIDKKNIEIANGQHHTLFLNAGKVYSLGRADYGRLGTGKDAKESSTPLHVTSLDGQVISKIACGEVTSFAVSSKGDLYSWGMGNCLQLGTGEEDDVHIPTKVQGKFLHSDTHRVLGVSSGGQHTAILAREK